MIIKFSIEIIIICSRIEISEKAQLRLIFLENLWTLNSVKTKEWYNLHIYEINFGKNLPERLEFGERILSEKSIVSTGQQLISVIFF